MIPDNPAAHRHTDLFTSTAIPNSPDALLTPTDLPTPTAIPDSPDALLTRAELAAALTKAGYPITTATLATKATRGGGPPFQRWGPRRLYRWGNGLTWAQSLLSAPISSTSELNVATQAAPQPRRRRGRSRKLPATTIATTVNTV
jgi:hypothetical protein